MKYNNIADGAYVDEHREILKELGIWKHMTPDERALFAPCHKCEAYSDYAKCPTQNDCPCNTCENRKTEVEVDNRMVTLRRKYL